MIANKRSLNPHKTRFQAAINLEITIIVGYSLQLVEPTTTTFTKGSGSLLCDVDHTTFQRSLLCQQTRTKCKKKLC